MTLQETRYYEHSDHDVIKCGSCWSQDIVKTINGEYTGDEAVRAIDLRLMPDEEPLQCDTCLVQNESYEELGEEV